MKDLNILDFIDSDDIREYNKNTKFSPFQQAILIDRCRSQSVEKRIEALEWLLKRFSIEEFSYKELEDGKRSLKEIVENTSRLWKDGLNDRYDNHKVIYEACFDEVDYTDREDGIGKLFSTYGKAHDYILQCKQHYLADEDLKDCRTVASIRRLEVDGDIDVSYEKHGEYLFGSDMQMVYVSRMEKDTFLNPEYLSAYSFYLPLPFKAGDIVRYTSPFHKTYYGVFPCSWEKPLNKYGSSLTISLDTYCAEDKWFDIAYDVPVLELSRCSADELPEDQRILRVIGAARKNEIDFYSILNYISSHRLDDMVKWFYK